jgi:NAD(P)-dependent dehydrogenase (short-subunit alcohol dehydrogenase family)
MQIEEAGALVTGGASGLGEATVRRLTARGAVVTIVDRDGARAEALAKELGRGTQFATADVTDADQVQAAVDQAAAAAPLRIVVNCAGLGWAGRVVNRDGSPHDLGAFQFVINVNLIGTFNGMRIGGAAIAKTEPVNDDGARGVIVNTASVAAFDGQIGQIAYSASKGGIVGMTLPAARDLAPIGVRVLTIAPGTMDTPLLGQLPEEGRQALAANIPFPKRLGLPEDFAALVEHMVENDYLNGETVRLDGAIRMPPK